LKAQLTRLVSALGPPIGTLVRYHMKRKAMLAAPAWTTPADAVGNIVPFVKVTTKVEREH